MWIDTYDGEFVNLDRIVFIRPRTTGAAAEVVAYTGTLDSDGVELEYVLFLGSLAACDGYMVALKERLRGWDRLLTV